MAIEISLKDDYLNVKVIGESGTIGTVVCDSAKWVKPISNCYGHRFTAYMGKVPVFIAYAKTVCSSTHYEVDAVGIYHYHNYGWSMDEIKSLFKNGGRA